MAAGKFQEYDGTSTSFLENFFIKAPQESEGTSSSMRTDDDSTDIDYIQKMPQENISDIGASSCDELSPPKRIGFFASRLAQKDSVIPVPKLNVSDSNNKNNQILEQKTSAPFSTWTKTKATTFTKPDKSFKERLTLESIDPEVLQNLPAEIQEEIRSHLEGIGNSKKELRSATSTKGIAKFFKVQPLPSPKKTQESEDDSAVCGALTLDVNEQPNTSKEDLVICERCNKQISVWTLPEHNDYHVAVDLQKNFSSASVQPKVEDGPARNNKVQGKRKGKPSKATVMKPKKVRSISSFFNPSSSAST